MDLDDCVEKDEIVRQARRDVTSGDPDGRGTTQSRPRREDVATSATGTKTRAATGVNCEHRRFAADDA